MRSCTLDSDTISIFEEPLGAGAQSAIRPASQQERVEAIMCDGNWHTLPEIKKELKRRFGALHGEASISARLRDMRKRGFQVEYVRTRPGSNLYQYRAFNLSTQTLTANGQVVVL